MDDLPVRLLAVTTLYEIEQMSSKPRSLARRINESCSELRRSWAAPALQVVAGVATSSSGHTEHTDASSLSLPNWLHRELTRSTPLQRYGHRLLERPDFLGLNVDPSTGTREDYVAKLGTLGFEASLSALAPHGVVVHSRPRDVASLPGVLEGSVHVQDPAQQWSCSMLAPLTAGGRLLDACAAPGGKTRAFLRYRSHTAARVVALERSEYKCGRMHALFAADARIRVCCGDATDPDSWWDGEPFEAIIADVPCSATAIMRSRPEVKVHQTAETVASLQRTQLAILRALWPLLQDGGQLLYTTCSLLSCENEDVVEEFMLGTGVCASVIQPKLPPAIDREDYCMRGHGVTIFPSKWHQGSFAALLRKEASMSAVINDTFTGRVSLHDRVRKRRKVRKVRQDQRKLM